ncbi:MAG: hypothetical protein IJE10_09220 [Clostridia bacterium]|nr:hypothetical protein [Clostridia bacterium]
MAESRTHSSFQNLKYGMLNTLLITILPFVTRTFFIKFLGQNYLGIDAVFLNIINMIEIVNVGIGTAITYSVYKPIADGDTEKCRTLFRLYRTCYYIIGVVVLCIGLALMPFLDSLLKETPDIPENLYVIYLFMLLSTVSFYFFADKQCVIVAHQKSYIVSKVKIVSVAAINILEIFFLFLTKKYMVYLALQSLQNTVIYGFVSYKAKKLYPQFFGGKVNPVDPEDKKNIVKNTTALVFNRAGSLIINCTDSFIIASCVNVASAGFYSNYLVIKNALNNFTMMFTSSLTASIGNLNASEKSADKQRLYDVFCHTYFVNYFIHAFCSICMICLFEPFIALWLGKTYCMGIEVVLIVTANFYFLGVQKTAEQFKSACGLFWQDRYRVFIESIMNLIVSLILVRHYGVFGVLAGTLISNILVTFWVEPLIVYKHALQRNVWLYYSKNAAYLLIAAAGAFLMYKLNFLVFGMKTSLVAFVLRAGFTAVLTAAFLLLVFARNNYLKETVKMAKTLLFSRFLKHAK